MREVLDGSPPYLLAAGAIVCFTLAIWLALREKVAAATLMSALFLVCVVLAYFPQLDSIKAFSVDVRLRKSLDRAEEILVKLRNISIVSAKATYLTVPWNSRLGGMSLRDKQELLDSVDSQLQMMGVDHKERKEIAHPHVVLIGFDLYQLFYNSARMALWHLRLTPTEAEGAKRLADWEARWRPMGVEPLGRHLYDGTALITYMEGQISPDLFGEKDSKLLQGLAKNIGLIFDSCIKRSGYTDDAIQFFEIYESAPTGPEEYYNFFVRNNNSITSGPRP